MSILFNAKGGYLINSPPLENQGRSGFRYIKVKPGSGTSSANRPFVRNDGGDSYPWLEN